VFSLVSRQSFWAGGFLFFLKFPRIQVQYHSHESVAISKKLTYSLNDSIHIFMSKTKKDWHGILRLDEFIIKRDDKVLFSTGNLYNILHTQGEAQILSALFLGGPTSNSYIPTLYYLGLDARGTLATSDTLSSLVAEPSTGGYSRQPVSSTTGFTIVTEGSTVLAKSGVLAFSATGSNWGPVSNMFLTNVASGTGGILYSSVSLGVSGGVTVNNGESVSMRFSMALSNC